MKPGEAAYLLLPAAVAVAVSLLCNLGPGGCRTATLLGSESLYYLAGIALYAVLDAGMGAYLVSAVAMAASITVMLKTLLQLPRPPAWEWLAHAEGPGFPSGHATVAAAFWLGLGLARGPAAALLGLAAAVAVGYTRLALHVHSHLDVAGGLAVGAAAALAAQRLGGAREGTLLPALMAPPAFLAASLAAAAAPSYASAVRLLGIDAGLAAAGLYMLGRGCAPQGPSRGRERPAALAAAAAGLSAAAASAVAGGPVEALGFAVFSAATLLGRCLVHPPRTAGIDAVEG